jgi:purine operon repressor
MRKSERLIRVTKELLNHPDRAVTLTELATRLDAAKSSLSEDVAMVRSVLEQEQEGTVETIAGAAGGIRFRVQTPALERQSFLSSIAQQLSNPSRRLPGNFIYMSDVLGHPDVLDSIGRLFAEEFAHAFVNVVVTVETKGIPLAMATARYLHVPLVIVRREHKLSEGPAISMHYVSGSERRVQSMSVSKRTMPENARALIVDDFMRAGATVEAVQNLLAEFSVDVAGTAVFVATAEPIQKRIHSYFSLLTVMNGDKGETFTLYPTQE